MRVHRNFLMFSLIVTSTTNRIPENLHLPEVTRTQTMNANRALQNYTPKTHFRFTPNRINVGPRSSLRFKCIYNNFSIEYRSVIKSALSHPILFANNVMAKISIIAK